MKKYFFLDFDGVLCDSAKETFVSSWIAYYKYFCKTEPSSVPISLYWGYRKLRPFLRESEDNILIQQILAEKEEVNTQADFDKRIAKAGQDLMLEYKRLFEQARLYLLNLDKKAWLNLCPLYPFIKQNKDLIFTKENLYILSTKKPEFINEILNAEDVYLKAAKIIYAGNLKKLDLIEKFLNHEVEAEAYFLDDQPDHLKNNIDPRIKTFLPSWGYVRSEWLKREDGIGILNQEDFLALLREN